MIYVISINQKKALDLELNNINQVSILTLLCQAQIWAEPIIKNNIVYYWISRNKIADELPLCKLKPDTVYRHLKQLHQKEIIEYVKINKKDCFRLLEKGKKYSFELGNKSENHQNSEINPKKLGNKSEKYSEINPTYNNTIYNKYTNNKKNPLLVDFNEEDKKLAEWFIAYRKTIKAKPYKTSNPIKAFIKTCKELQKLGYNSKEFLQTLKDNEWQTLKVEYIHKTTKQANNTNGVNMFGSSFAPNFG